MQNTVLIVIHLVSLLTLIWELLEGARIYMCINFHFRTWNLLQMKIYLPQYTRNFVIVSQNVQKAITKCAQDW